MSYILVAAYTLLSSKDTLHIFWSIVWIFLIKNTYHEIIDTKFIVRAKAFFKVKKPFWASWSLFFLALLLYRKWYIDVWSFLTKWSGSVALTNSSDFWTLRNYGCVLPERLLLLNPQKLAEMFSCGRANERFRSDVYWKWNTQEEE